MLTIGVLGSGIGGNMQSVLDAIAAGKLDARVACVISDVPGAMILNRARKAGIPAEHVDASPFRTKLDGAAEERVVKELQRRGVNMVVLSGFMRIIKDRLLGAFPSRIVNIHPALLPSFAGPEAWKKAVEYGAKITGCTVHFVDSGMGTGPIILQRPVPILDNDTPESLQSRIQEAEFIAYPEALQLIALGKVHLSGRRVVVRS